MAFELGITPVHLNRICNLATGKSAGQLMDEHLLDEAKKYLKYTSYSVSQVAYLLKFEYPNYFARFFKKHTSISPSISVTISIVGNYVFLYLLPISSASPTRSPSALLR